MEATSPLLTSVGVAHGFGGRRGGVSQGAYASANASLASGDDPAAVAENRRRFAVALGAVPEALCTLRQVHGTAVHVAEAPSQHRVVGDAVVSAVPGLILAVTTADCVPVLVVDADARCAAAIHAGWRSATSGIIAASLEALCRLGATPGRCLAVIGPCIRAAGYEVDQPVRDAALAADPSAGYFFASRDVAERWQFDLAGFVARQLDQSGVKEVDDTGLDTLNQSSNYFSYRRSRQRGEAGYGVQLSGIVVPG
ncbi:MAG: peptidoglycan editing factor PgeF [Geminicoccaceae bacterium]|nr:MAG: peptidoglycan editing factor PgeF [Geminicoccaceae bacterium]